MDLKEYKYKVEELALYPELIETSIGYGAGKSPEPIRQVIDDTIYLARDLCDIKGGFLIFNNISFKPAKNLLYVNGNDFEIQKIIYQQLKKSDAVALFLCTAGPDIGDYADRQMKQGNLLDGYILDIIGSEIVEAAMDKMQDELEQHFQLQGLQISNRYSPGYCGWNVSEQQKLFSLFPENFCGVTLTPHSLMQPVKSVSGIIGIGSDVNRKGYACNICDMDHCIYRKKQH
jgi:hypothetical protein